MCQDFSRTHLLGSPDFIDAPFAYDTLNLGSYLQSPQFPYGVSCKSELDPPSSF